MNRLIWNLWVWATLWPRLQRRKLSISARAAVQKLSLEHFGITFLSEILRVIFRAWHAKVLLDLFRLKITRYSHLHGLQFGDVLHQGGSQFLRATWADKPIVAKLLLNVEWLVGQRFLSIDLLMLHYFWIYVCAIFFTLHYVFIYLKYIKWLLIIIRVLNDWIIFWQSYRVWASYRKWRLAKLALSSPFFVKIVTIK